MHPAARAQRVTLITYLIRHPFPASLPPHSLSLSFSRLLEKVEKLKTRQIEQQKPVWQPLPASTSTAAAASSRSVHVQTATTTTNTHTHTPAQPSSASAHTQTLAVLCA